jgi:hypothetical protein
MKEIFSSIAIVLAFIAYIPYYRDILRGKTHPHVYTWILWTLVTMLLIALQIKGGAGPAMWVTVAGGLFCAGIVILSLKRGKKNITRMDTIVALLALIATGFWWFANQPVISAALLILSDALAFTPTIRKSWIDPYSETLSMYATNAVRFGLTFTAIETYTFLSASWIVFWLLGNTLFSLMLVVRRKQVNLR